MCLLLSVILSDELILLLVCKLRSMDAVVLIHSYFSLLLRFSDLVCKLIGCECNSTAPFFSFMITGTFR